MKNHIVPLLIAHVLLTTGCASSQIAVTEVGPLSTGAEPTNTVVFASDVDWQPLNPARGDASPMAANLWGDRAGAGPTGFLVRFVEGFESPPHIHNVSYRGVVIRGLVHNDDPKAKEMWMPAGSFWTQPRGAVHITAAAGSETVAYIEIDDGPYLVRPVDEAAPSGERAVNLDAANIDWVDAPNTYGPPNPSESTNPAQVAFLWGNPQDNEPNGALIKLPAGTSSLLRSDGPLLHAVVIQGQPAHRVEGGTKAQRLPPGSHFSSDGGSALSCEAGQDCLLYVRARGTIDIRPMVPKP